MNDKLLTLKQQLARLYRFTNENAYELRSLLSSYEALVTTYRDGKAYHNGDTLEVSELSGYVSTFMDHSISKPKREAAYRVVYDVLKDRL